MNGGGPTYAAQTLNYNNLAMLDSVAFTNPITNINFGSGIRPTNVTMTVCMTLGMPGQANGNDYDTFWIQDGSGHGSIAQIGNGCGGASGELGISIEANSPFAHSACIRLFPAQTYFFSLNVNGTTACAGGAGSCSTLTAYTPNGTQIGQVNVASSFSGLTNIRIPSNENGTDSGTTHYQNAMVVWTGTIPLSLFWTQTDPSAGVLAPTRTGAWSSAGVTGGIPTGRTQCVNTACAAISGSSTAANIQSAFTGAPANTYVLLPAVTYPFCLSLAGASKVTLRGAGANKTIFAPTSSCGGAGISVTNTGGTNEGSPATVSGMTIPGTNVLTLSSVSGLAVGDPIVIDQHDSTTDLGGLLILGTTSAYTGPFTSPGNAGPYSIDGETQNARCPGGQNVPATCFHQEQISVVTNISGSNVTISPALEMPNWLPGNTMSAWWASSPIQYDGIEDLTVNTTGASGSDGIDLTWCANCWTKGVAVINTNLAHVQANYGANDQVENSYFFLTQNHVTSSYGVVCNSASSMLIENNIFHGIASPVIWNGTCNNAVAGYNFNANDYYTASAGFSQNFYGEHSGGVDMSLLEGNITQNWAAADNIHGTGNLSTFLPQCYHRHAGRVLVKRRGLRQRDVRSLQQSSGSFPDSVLSPLLQRDRKRAGHDGPKHFVLGQRLILKCRCVLRGPGRQRAERCERVRDDDALGERGFCDGLRLAALQLLGSCRRHGLHFVASVAGLPDKSLPRVADDSRFVLLQLEARLVAERQSMAHHRPGHHRRQPPEMHGRHADPRASNQCQPVSQRLNSNGILRPRLFQSGHGLLSESWRQRQRDGRPAYRLQ